MKLLIKKYKIIFITAVPVIIIVGLVYWLWARNRVSTDDAYVDGHIFVITSRISGYVTQVHIDDNQFVEKDQPLVSLDSTDYEVALAQAEAQLAQNRSTLSSLELGVPLQLDRTTEQVRGAKAELNSLLETLEQLRRDEDAAAQEVVRLQAQYRLAELDLKRKTALRAGEAISQQTLDESEANYDATLAQLKNAQAKLESVKKQRAAQESNIDLKRSQIALAETGETDAEIKAREVEAQKARVHLAEAQVEQAKLNLSYTRIASPVHGYVTKKNIESGQFVTPTQILMYVVPLNPPNVWITANFKETELTYVRPGQPVNIEVDTYPGVVIRGKVDSLMGGTGAVFSLLPPENATGNFVKVVQRIPVKITIDEAGGSHIPTLRLGMSVIPTIYVGK